MTKHTFAVVVVSTFAVIGCGKSQKQQCTDGVAAGCKQAYACLDAATLMAPLIQAVYGTSQDNCLTTLAAYEKCDQLKNDGKCPDGTTTWNSAKSDQCLKDVQAQSCADVKTLMPPASCSAVCPM